MCRGGRCHGLLLLLVLVLRVAVLVLLLFEATELRVIHQTAAPAYASSASRRLLCSLDDLHRQTVGGRAQGLCWRESGRRCRTRKRSHPLDHVRKVHPLGM